jgi:hypothetical protein
MSSPDVVELVLARMDAQDRKLDEIHAQAVKTNGRVTRLEAFRERLEGRMEGLTEAKAWRAPFLIGTASAAAGAFLTAGLAAVFGAF